MKRNVSLEEISDGRLYGYNDMVKADCHGCAGCHKCCTGMGNSVILDPYDVWRMQKGLHKTMQELLGEGKLELHVVDGCILPNLAMSGPEEACGFLDEKGRCSIHAYRPGICRLFPLGRYYENGDFRFFLQTGECRETNRSKVKVSKWLDTPELKKNQQFLADWHSFRKTVEQMIADTAEEQTVKTITMFLLNTFFVNAYDVQEDFYSQFYERLNKIKGALGL